MNDSFRALSNCAVNKLSSQIGKLKNRPKKSVRLCTVFYDFEDVQESTEKAEKIAKIFLQIEEFRLQFKLISIHSSSHSDGSAQACCGLCLSSA